MSGTGKAAPDNLPDKITVGQFTYRLRRFTPKRKGQVVGHDWVRQPPHHVALVGQETHTLIDEIARLRVRQASPEAQRWARLGFALETWVDSGNGPMLNAEAQLAQDRTAYPIEIEQ